MRKIYLINIVLMVCRSSWPKMSSKKNETNHKTTTTTKTIKGSFMLMNVEANDYEFASLFNLSTFRLD